MPSYFDEDIPMGRRNEKDIRMHRNIRRNIGPDFLSMEFVSTYVPHQPTYANDPPFIGYCDGHLSHKESINTGGPYAYLHVYPYTIPVFSERLSLNKKKRWLTSGGLESKVGTYEDDERKIRVSFVRSVMSHIERKSNNGGEIKEVLPRKDVEVITASKLGIKHWQNVRTNHTDLLRQPMPPKRISGHGNSNYSDVCEDSMLGEEYLHIVYTETTHRVSKKEASKLQRCERNEKKKIRRQYVTPKAKCKAVSAGEYFKEYSEDMKFIDDYEGIDDHSALTASGSRENTLKDFIVDRPSKRFRIRRLKVRAECPEYYYPSQMPNNTDEENFNDYAENPLNNIHFPYPDPLPSCTVVLEDDLESNHQVMQLMASANKIMRFSPETFILHSARDNCFLGCGLTEKFQGYVSFCLATECSASGTLQRVIRLTFNSTEERKPETRPEKQKIATPIDLRHILPADCFLSADCSEENDCRKAAVDNWLRTINDNVETRNGIAEAICNVCAENNTDCFSLHCGHFFCSQCWLNYSVEQIRSGNVPISCMDARCGCVLELNQILTFLPYELCLRYEKLVWGKVVVQKDWLFCENCQRAIHVNVCSNNNSHKQYYPIVACKCGHSHCVMCKRTWHWPLSCNLAERYNDVLESYGESMVHARRKKIVGLRRCPSCRSFFERSYGCNHITCACSYEFCYVCGGKWNSGAHYKCKAVERMKVTSVYLFDVIIGRCNDILKSFLNRNWEMREFRTPLGRWKLKKRTQWMRSDAETILKTCQAVLHVIEFCKIAVFSLHKNRGNSYTTSGSALTGRNGVLYFGSNSQFVRTVKRIKFINSRLDVALAQKKEASNVLFLRDLLVRHIRCLLSPCRIPSDVNP